MRNSTSILVLSLVALLALPLSASADEERLENEAGLGVASAAASLIYSPAKLIYAGGGGLVAGMAYVASGGDASVAGPILDASLRGDYVLTPDHLLGQRGIEFVGRAPEARLLRQQSEAWEDVNTEIEEEEAPSHKSGDEYGPWRSPEEEGRDSAWVNQ